MMEKSYQKVIQANCFQKWIIPQGISSGRVEEGAIAVDSDPGAGD
jgi:hypothetical protein